jgi:hypothetical protein
MFGDGIFNWAALVFCLGICAFFPLAIALATLISIRLPGLRGPIFGLVFGTGAYAVMGFLFGDTVGLVFGTIVFIWFLIFQPTVVWQVHPFADFTELPVYDRWGKRRHNVGDDLSEHPTIEIPPSKDK